jgi:23S rRNA pseudouridine1911/1915/1917 synthase
MKFCAKENPTYPFCDNHLLLVDKPAGIPTQKGIDLVAKEWIKKKFEKPGNVFLEPVHRLDKPVSGLLLFARTSKALSRMQEAMRERSIQKTYYALVEGIPPIPEAVLENLLIHDSYHARVVEHQEKGAKEAKLFYRVLKTEEGLSFLEIELYTGRYHQIRAQLSFIGCPILGDAKYGSKRSYPLEGIALHHGRLSFPHPVSQEQLKFTSTPPYFL